MDLADTFTAKVIDLRARGLTPKQIAKALGARRADVEPVIRAHAQVAQAAEPQRLRCWISPGWSAGLRWDGHPAWHDAVDDDPDDRGDTIPRIACVLIARENRHGKVSVCGYLVDAHCLGVKNTVGPRTMDGHELEAFVRLYFSPYDAEPLPAPFDLAQALVLGADAYAHRLGFASHPNFAACRAHLGDMPAPSPIEFGYHGKPYYISGPNDDVAAVLRTLNHNPGPGNFDFLAMG